MTLSELYELSPLGYELIKNECIKLRGKDRWENCVKYDRSIITLFRWNESKHSRMFHELYWNNDTTLLKQWEAKQITK